jgi:hypothetical protein
MNRAFEPIFICGFDSTSGKIFSSSSSQSLLLSNKTIAISASFKFLDIFSELEVNSLMYCGYKFLEDTLQHTIHKEVNSQNNWKFLNIENHFDKDLKRKFFQELELSTKKSINKYTKKIKKWCCCI